MKKTLNRSLAVLLAFIMIFSTFGIQTFALTADKQWENYFNSYLQDGRTVVMSPGADDTQRNFSWYSSLKSGKGVLYLSETKDFKNYKTFTASKVITFQGDCRNKVTVTGLAKGKTYYYKCVNGSDSSDVYSFKTMKDKSFTAMYVTDIHITHDEEGLENPIMTQSYGFHKVLEDAKLKTTDGLDLIISSGDQATYGLRKEYQGVFASPELRSIPFAFCVGNHDRKGADYKFINNNPNIYKKGVSSYIGPDYYYVKGDVLFLVYDSNCKSSTTHKNFTKAAVEANPDVKWRIAVMHHDMYGKLTDGRLEDSVENRRPVFVPIFDEFKIDFAFLGHSHYYSISNVMYNNKITQNISGQKSVTDPAGTIVMVSGSISHARTIDMSEIPVQDTIAYYYSTNDMIYNIVDFSNDTMSIKSYTLGSEKPFNALTVKKTTADGGHPEYSQTLFAPVKRSAFEFLAFFEELAMGIKAVASCIFG